MPKQTKSLVQKIAEACRSVDSLAKQGKNDEYSYLRILDLSNALREKLFDAGVIIVPSDKAAEITTRESDVPGRLWFEASVTTEFQLNDGAQTISLISAGFARDMEGKSVAMAQTAALKAFLKRLALIFGENDDPEVQATRPWKTKAEIAEQER